MAKETKRNPWDIDNDTIENQEKENKASTKGVICLKRNSSIGGTCNGCDYISNQIYSKDYPDKHPARVWASQHKSKQNIFFNMVKSSDPNTPMVINMKNEAGSYILSKAKDEWPNLLNPHPGKGLELLIKKVKKSGSKGGTYLSYDVSPVLQPPDWEVPEKVWKKMATNLDQSNLIRMLMEGEFNDTNYFDVASLKEGESIRIRILPSWQNGEHGADNTRFAEWVWRHWGLSEAQIKGTEPISWEGEVEAPDDAVDEPSLVEDKVEVKEQHIEPEENLEKELPCFGKKRYFSEEDEICIACKKFKPCAIKVSEEE